MRLLIDDTPYGGSEANTNEEAVQSADREFFKDAPETFDNSEYGAADHSQTSRRRSLIDEAKRGIKRGKATMQRTVPKAIGKSLGDKQLFMEDSQEGRDRTKEKVKQKARNYAKDKIGEKIADEGIKKGFQKGLSKGAKDLAKSGTKKLAKGATEKVAEEGVKQGAKLAARGAVDIIGGATGFETFGLGFLLAFLLNIAISLGVSDAVDAAFELKDGNFKQAYFLAVRAGSKVGIFIYFLITIIFTFSIAGIFISVPLLILLNIYAALGFAFRKIPQLQGMVWWELVILAMIDVMALLIFLAFLGALGWYLCGQGSVGNTVIGAVAAIYDWWEKSSAGSVAADFCKYVNIDTTAVPPVQ